MPGDKPGPPLVRALGLLVGDFWSVVTGRPRSAPPERRVVRSDVEEETRETSAGTVKLRRTTVEEIEVERPRET